jgi:hypothetical protein
MGDIDDSWSQFAFIMRRRAMCMRRRTIDEDSWRFVRWVNAFLQRPAHYQSLLTVFGGKDKPGLTTQGRCKLDLPSGLSSGARHLQLEAIHVSSDDLTFVLRGLQAMMLDGNRTAASTGIQRSSLNHKL